MRRLRLVPPGEGIPLVLDSTGLSIVGGRCVGGPRNTVAAGRRGWRKLHLGIDRSGVILGQTLTEETSDDATTGLDLLNAVEGPLVRVGLDPAVSCGHRNSSANFSDGFIQPRVCRGRSLSLCATRSRYR